MNDYTYHVLSMVAARYGFDIFGLGCMQKLSKHDDPGQSERVSLRT